MHAVSPIQLLHIGFHEALDNVPGDSGLKVGNAECNFRGSYESEMPYALYGSD